MAEDALALLDHLGIQRAHVLGHSMGGFAALDLAAAFPERVDRLILAGTAARCAPELRPTLLAMCAELEAGGNREAWFTALYRGIFSAGFMARPGILEACLQWAQEDPYPQDPAAFRRQVEAALAFDGRETLAGLACPCLVLAGA
jgi:pimeloyl-ACP methyl ester carboxylesterase